jgi:hypothetical protein
MAKESPENYPEKETERRRDTALLRALSTPHKHQSEMKLGKPKPVAKASQKEK